VVIHGEALTIAAHFSNVDRGRDGESVLQDWEIDLQE
jgi:hypothetical protein